jgi:hypothetical protein
MMGSYRICTTAFVLMEHYGAGLWGVTSENEPKENGSILARNNTGPLPNHRIDYCLSR